MTKDFYRHTLCLSAAFTLGQSVIFLPKQSTLNFFIAAVITFFILFALTKILKNKKVLPTAVYSLLFFVSLISGAVCFFEYCVFVKERMLTKTSAFLIILFFAAGVLVFFLSEKNTVFKFSLVAFTFIAILRAAVGFFLLKNVNFKTALKQSLGFSFGGTACALLILLPSAVVFFYIFLQNENLKAGLLGFSLSSVQMITFSVLTLGILGAGAFKRPFSLIDAVSTANMGRVFTRSDGVLYVIFYVSALIKSGVCFKCAEISFKKTKFHL